MSNSKRVRERRQRRARMSKGQRAQMGQQHWGDTMGSIREERKRQNQSALAAKFPELFGGKSG